MTMRSIQAPDRQTQTGGDRHADYWINKQIDMRRSSCAEKDERIGENEEGTFGVGQPKTDFQESLDERLLKMERVDKLATRRTGEPGYCRDTDRYKKVGKKSICLGLD